MEYLMIIVFFVGNLYKIKEMSAFDELQEYIEFCREEQQDIPTIWASYDKIKILFNKALKEREEKFYNDYNNADDIGHYLIQGKKMIIKNFKLKEWQSKQKYLK